jgi:predicted membrane-bound spermidine synthase
LVDHQDTRIDGYTVKPYQTTVPSFGVWGYALAKLGPFETPVQPPPGVDLKFLNNESFAADVRVSIGYEATGRARSK